MSRERAGGEALEQLKGQIVLGSQRLWRKVQKSIRTNQREQPVPSICHRNTVAMGLVGAVLEAEDDHDPRCGRGAAADGNGGSLIAPFVLGRRNKAEQKG